MLVVHTLALPTARVFADAIFEDSQDSNHSLGAGWRSCLSPTAGPRLEHQNAHIPLTTLTISSKDLSDDDTSTAYAQSANAVARLIDLAGKWSVVVFLQNISRGRPLAKVSGEQMLVPWNAFAGERIG
jgi:hypothetical protein